MIDHRTLLLLVVLPTSALAARPPKNDLRPLQGTWKIKANVVDGTAFPKGLLAKARVIIKGDQMTQKPELVIENGTFKLGDPAGFTVTLEVGASKSPKHLDVVVVAGKEKVRARGAYLLEKDTLKICFNPKARPKDFTSKAGSGNILLVLEREKK
jgi:uncharacterized protein (TIGR03067 family)